MKNIPRMITLTEILKVGDSFKEQDCIVNIEGIVMVQDAELTISGTPILDPHGKFPRPQDVRIVTLTTGYKVNVKESLKEIAEGIRSLLG